jgi:hypothetical protein
MIEKKQEIKSSMLRQSDKKACPAQALARFTQILHILVHRFCGQADAR